MIMTATPRKKATAKPQKPAAASLRWKLEQTPPKGRYPNYIAVSSRFVCNGKFHYAAVTNKGQLIFSHHTLADLRREAKLAVFSETKCTCLELYQGWIRGEQNELTDKLAAGRWIWRERDKNSHGNFAIGAATLARSLRGGKYHHDHASCDGAHLIREAFRAARRRDYSRFRADSYASSAPVAADIASALGWSVEKTEYGNIIFNECVSMYLASNSSRVLYIGTWPHYEPDVAEIAIRWDSAAEPFPWRHAMVLDRFLAYHRCARKEHGNIKNAETATEATAKKVASTIGAAPEICLETRRWHVASVDPFLQFPADVNLATLRSLCQELQKIAPKLQAILKAGAKRNTSWWHQQKLEVLKSSDIADLPAAQRRAIETAE